MQFKEGDKVKVVANPLANDEVERVFGQEGVINSIGNDSFSEIQVEFSDGAEKYFYEI